MDTTLNNTSVIGLSIKYITIILSLPLYLFWSVTMVAIVIHTYPPFIFLVHRIHNEFNPNHKIKLYSFYKGEYKIKEDDTFSSWIKLHTSPNIPKVFNVVSFIYFAYIIVTYIIAIYVGCLAIQIIKYFL